MRPDASPLLLRLQLTGALGDDTPLCTLVQQVRARLHGSVLPALRASPPLGCRTLPRTLPNELHACWMLVQADLEMLSLSGLNLTGSLPACLFDGTSNLYQARGAA